MSLSPMLAIGIGINALIVARTTVLYLQDGEDRVEASVARDDEVLKYELAGMGFLVMAVALSPMVTAVWLLKKLMFPRGIKSKFAKEQERRAKELAARKAEARRRKRMKRQLREVLAWSPGSILAASQRPVPPALPWQMAADAFDAAERKVREDAGLPWSVGVSTQPTINNELETQDENPAQARRIGSRRRDGRGTRAQA